MQKDAKFTVSDHFVYAGNNPVRFVDPFGLDPRKETINLIQDLDNLRKEMKAFIEAIAREEKVAITPEVAERQYISALGRLVTRIEQDVKDASMRLRRSSNEVLDITAHIQFGDDRITGTDGNADLNTRLRQYLERSFARERAQYVNDVKKSIEEDKRLSEQKLKHDKDIQATYSGANAQKEMLRQVVVPVIVTGAIAWLGGAVLDMVGGGGAGGTPLWSSTGTRNPVQNAFQHWKDHAVEFPEFQNAKQYVEGARKFYSNPPKGTLIKLRNGDTLFYDPASNTFGVQAASGAPRTMFRPTDGINYWNRQ